MSKKIYVGVNNKAQRVKKVYVGINNIAHQVKKIYIGINDTAKLVFSSFVKVIYQSKMNLSFTEKDLIPNEDTYIFPLTSSSDRVDFWFNLNDTAKNDSSKKYIDYPWCAYADANPNLYSAYNYNKDLLAKHWNEIGSKNNYNLGGINTSTLCTNYNDHTIQHIARPKSIKWTGKMKTFGSDSDLAWEVFDSKGTKIHYQDNLSYDTSWNLYPGMKITFYVRQHTILFGTNNCAIYLNGKKKKNGAGSFTYTIPDDILTIDASKDFDLHLDGSWSEIIKITTKSASYV